MNLTMTQKAIDKLIETIDRQEDPENIVGLRVSVVGGGCSGFQYSMAFVRKDSTSLLDKTKEFESSANIEGNRKILKVVVDQASLLYLDGCEIDYVNTLESSGFKFNNPNVKSTCGCGSSFQA